MALKTCEFACPANLFSEYTVRPDAATDVHNSNFPNEVWTSDTIVKDAFTRTHVAAGCLLKAFNDGNQLPSEHGISHAIDITCVGPDSPACPAAQGYHLVPTTTIFGELNEVRI